MAKKKNKDKATKKEVNENKVFRTPNKFEVNEKKTKDLVEISCTRTDVESFLEKFRADVARKRKEYQEYAQEHRKKKKF